MNESTQNKPKQAKSNPKPKNIVNTPTKPKETNKTKNSKQNKEKNKKNTKLFIEKNQLVTGPQTTNNIKKLIKETN